MTESEQKLLDDLSRRLLSLENKFIELDRYFDISDNRVTALASYSADLAAVTGKFGEKQVEFMTAFDSFLSDYITRISALENRPRASVVSEINDLFEKANPVNHLKVV